jgi:hypothetical protein
METNAQWEEFKSQLKEVGKGIRAWMLLKKPMFELWAKEGGEGITAFAIAVLQGEAGRAKAMALNTGNDTTSVIGFNTGLVEREAFWIVIQGVLAGGKIPGWILPIIAEMLKQAKGGNP